MILMDLPLSHTNIGTYWKSFYLVKSSICINMYNNNGSMVDFLINFSIPFNGYYYYFQSLFMKVSYICSSLCLYKDAWYIIQYICPCPSTQYYVKVSLEVVFQLFVSQVFISLKDSPIQTFQTQFEKINKEM